MSCHFTQRRFDERTNGHLNERVVGGLDEVLVWLGVVRTGMWTGGSFFSQTPVSASIMVS